MLVPPPISVCLTVKGCGRMIRIAVPATTANFGSGFDCLGAALDCYNIIEMEERDGCFIEILDDTSVPVNEENLIYTTARELYRRCGREFRGLHIRQRNSIPTARGLGSSSACIAGGLLGANELMGRPCPLQHLVDIAAELEGHPDNSTPALLGGFVAAAMDGGRVYYSRCELSPKLAFLAAVPDFELKTADARRVLPAQVSRGDAVFNLSRSAVLAMSMAQGRVENFRLGTDDRLHQPHRLKLIPGAERVFAFFDREEVHARYLSGAGPTLMAIIDTARGEELRQALRQFLDDSGLPGWKALLLHPSGGARLLGPDEH